MSYNLLKPYHLIKAVSMASSITSTPVENQYQDNVGIQLTWTGSPTGPFSVQVSVDYAIDNQGNVTNAGNWVTLTLSAPIAAIGSPDTAYIDLNQLTAPYYRVVYTASSGTGTLDSYIIGKGV